MAIVEFNVEVFRSRHAGLQDETKYGDDYLFSCFAVAESIVDNTEGSPIPYNPGKRQFERETLLYLATCHIATLLGGADGESPLGRVASASQGSVSTSFDLASTNSSSGDWWNQTQCGALFWILTGKYRRGGRFYGVRTFHPYG